MMRMLIWNILHGGGPGRLPEIALVLVRHAPDLVILTEFRIARGSQLRGILADQGLAHQAVAQGSGENRVFIASREPLVQHASTCPFPERVLEVTLADSRLRVMGVHIPDDSRMPDKARYWAWLVETGRRLRDDLAVIAGDFNTARHGVDTDSMATGCEDRLGVLTTLGFVDAGRTSAGSRREETSSPEEASHPEEIRPREETWRSPFGEGARIDTALLSPAAARRIVSARYDHAPREVRHSDHSLLVLEFQAFTHHFRKDESTREGLFG